ncbi:MAG TPA: hypothetical protein VM165_05525 [Planctomycetaceae bacterium]|nr:hypothetical protein [Planctomycetaceae bacterium]
MPTSHDFELAYVRVVRNHAADVQPKTSYLRMLNAWKLIGRPADIEGFITKWMKLRETVSY